MREDGGDLARTLSRLAVIGLIGGLAGACSSDTMRFSGDPFASPFSSGAPAKAARSTEPSATGGIPDAAIVRSSPVQSQPLPAPLAAPQPQLRRSAATPLYNEPPATPRAPVRAAGATGGWTAQGGTTVTVNASETLGVIANRYSVPAQAILTANGLSGASQVTAGKQIVIPVYDAGGGAVRTASAQPVVSAPAKAAPAKPAPKAAQAPVAKPVPVAAPKPATVAKAVAPKAAPAPQAAAKKVEPVKVVAKPVDMKPAEVKPVAAKPAPAPAPQKVTAVETKPVVAPKVAAPAPQAAAPAAKAAPAPAEAPRSQATAYAPAAPAAVKEPEQTASVAPSADFRWPARGRVINGFGSAGNEGINIAVPEGTPVKAAEGGTVAYAGSEVKGYGNLVLVRHENGYVSAYAHNGELKVKRGEKVARGQVIARSGQSGNVTSPQLHFELRKGQQPVDPMPYLNN